MIGGTTKGTIWLRGKGGPRKPASKRGACPMRRTIRHRRSALRDGCRLNSLSRRDCHGFGKFRGTQFASGELLPQLQAQIPDPLAQDLPELLPMRGMGASPVGILLPIFISENRFKRAAMQVQI